MVGCIAEYRLIKQSPVFYMENQVGDEMVRISRLSEVSVSELCLCYMEQFNDGIVKI